MLTAATARQLLAAKAAGQDPAAAVPEILDPIRPQLAAGRAVSWARGLLAGKDTPSGGVLIRTSSEGRWTIRQHGTGATIYASAEQLAVSWLPAEILEAGRLRAEAIAQAEELLELEAAEEAQEGPSELVTVIPCSGAKLAHAAPAGELYTGSLHKLARQAAEALRGRHGGRVLILSAAHGLLELEQLLEPYDVTWGDPGEITPAELGAQARALGLLEATVVTLLPQAYRRALEAAGVPIYRDAFAGSRGIGDQRGRLSAIKAAGERSWERRALAA